MYTGDLRPHKKILIYVACAICLCILITFYKKNISGLFELYKDSYRSDCQTQRSRTGTPLPSKCYQPKHRVVQLSGIPGNIELKGKEQFLAPTSLSSELRRKISESNSPQDSDSKEKKNKFQFVINEESLCKTENSKPVILLVGVFTGLDEAPLRTFIRNYWGKVAQKDPKVKLVFILGEPKRRSFNLAPIKNESRVYHDIVQANFADTYRNLTLKSLALFQWTGTYCKDAKFVMKIDGDMKIDLLRLISVLEKGNFPDKYQCGYIIPAHTPTRDKHSKWYVPISIFPRNYPVYCSGPAYIVSKRIAEKISSYPIPKIPFPVDDAFMTGVLREELHEGVEKRIISFYHHHSPTDTVVKEGKFQKYIMKIDVHE